MGGDVGAGGLGDVCVAGDSGRRRRAPVVCNGAWREAGAARGSGRPAQVTLRAALPRGLPAVDGCRVCRNRFGNLMSNCISAKAPRPCRLIRHDQVEVFPQ